MGFEDTVNFERRMDIEDKIMSELCLGTVQFGMKYGINNKIGQPPEKECFEMLDMAINNGITVIDTARAYGTAEVVLGHYIESRKCKDKIKLISKLRPNIIESGEKDKYNVIYRECKASLERLHVNQLDGYLLHTPEYIYDDDIVDILQRLKKEGLVNNIGVSIYDMKEGFEAIEKGVDYIQLPYSVLDQRGVTTGFMDRAKVAGIKIFVRSVFLQGLFMMDTERIPEGLYKARPYLTKFEELLGLYGIGKVGSLINFVKNNKNIDYVVIGVEDKNQLLEDIKSFTDDIDLNLEFIKKVKTLFRNVEDNIILPSLWSNGKKSS